jgi:O-antigen/teichoic acid export membrane protein
MPSGRSLKIIVLTIGNGVNILISILMLPFLVRSLSYEEYGTYGQIQIILNLLLIVFLFSLNQSITILLSKSHNPKNTIHTVTLIALTLTFLGSISLSFLASTLAHSFENILIDQLLPLSLFQFAGQLFFSFYFSAAIFYDKVKQATLIVILTNILRIVGLFIAINYFNGLTAIIWVLNITSILQAIWIYLILPKIAKGIGTFELKTAKEVFSIGGPMMLTSITDRSAVYIDGLMISAMLTTTQYAIYRAGAFEVPFIASLYGSVSVILIPEVIKLIHGNQTENAVKLKNKAISTTAFIIYPILVYILFFSKPILTVYITDKYADSALIFSIFSLSLLVRINDYQDILIAKSKASRIFRISLIMLLINILLNYFFIKYWGILGGALAYILWLFGYASLLAYTTAIAVNKSIHDFFDFKKLFTILLISSLLSSVFYFLYYFYQNSFLAIGFAFVYLPLVYLILYRMKIIDNVFIEKLIKKIPIPFLNKKD